MKFYGVDLHSNNIQVSILDQDNLSLNARITLNSPAFQDFLSDLTRDDYVAVEASTNTFWFYAQVKDRVKQCLVINPFEFKLICHSAVKTDKRDSSKLAKLLRYSILQKDPSILPCVYVPDQKIIQLRSLFTSYEIVKKQKNMTKNRIHSLLKQNAIILDTKDIFKSSFREKILGSKVDEVALFQIQFFFHQLDETESQLKKLKTKILEQGKHFLNEIRLLTSIKGFSVITSLALISDIADINRFSNEKKLCSYLRTAPRIDSSNNKDKIGHVNKNSRTLTLNFLTQSILHFRSGSKKLDAFYTKKRKGKSAGKVRIAVMRKMIVIVFHILKKNELYFYTDKQNHQAKLLHYAHFLKHFSESA